MNTRKRFAGIIAGAALLISTGAAAGHDSSRHGGHYDYARVVEVTPITRLIEVSHPEQQCWSEPVRHEVRAGSQPNVGSMILGGVIGGVVGNRFGGGNGQEAMTAAGAILGAAMGNHIGQQRQPGYSYIENEQRCETVRSRHTEERIVGYDVRYRYNGEEFTTRTERDPGPRLRVRVAVTPVH